MSNPQWRAAALQGYAGAAPQGAIARAARLARRLGWLAVLARQVQRLRPRSRELRATVLTLTGMAQAQG